ncbi:MAG: hypothetical protein EB104_06275 [Acidimicrobiia bacterium]|nr:hypothetical protein [Acidimicrobiia bacterium]
MSTPYQEALGRTLIERSIREKIVIVGVTLDKHTDEQTEESLDELERLVDTAGADVVARLTQRRQAPDPATYIGKGKVDELKATCLAVDADTVVFDNELSPAQQFNLEKTLGRTAIDRTAVILDIFAQNIRVSADCAPPGRLSDGSHFTHVDACSHRVGGLCIGATVEQYRARLCADRNLANTCVGDESI